MGKTIGRSVKTIFGRSPVNRFGGIVPNGLIGGQRTLETDAYFLQNNLVSYRFQKNIDYGISLKEFFIKSNTRESKLFLNYTGSPWELAVNHTGKFTTPIIIKPTGNDFSTNGIEEYGNWFQLKCIWDNITIGNNTIRVTVSYRIPKESKIIEPKASGEQLEIYRRIEFINTPNPTISLQSFRIFKVSFLPINENGDDFVLHNVFDGVTYTNPRITITNPKSALKFESGTFIGGEDKTIPLYYDRDTNITGSIINMSRQHPGSVFNMITYGDPENKIGLSMYSIDPSGTQINVMKGASDGQKIIFSCEELFDGSIDPGAKTLIDGELYVGIRPFFSISRHVDMISGEWYRENIVPRTSYLNKSIKVRTDIGNSVKDCRIWFIQDGGDQGVAPKDFIPLAEQLSAWRNKIENSTGYSPSYFPVHWQLGQHRETWNQTRVGDYFPTRENFPKYVKSIVDNGFIPVSYTLYPNGIRPFSVKGKNLGGDENNVVIGRKSSSFNTAYGDPVVPINATTIRSANLLLNELSATYNTNSFIGINSGGSYDSSSITQQLDVLVLHNITEVRLYGSPYGYFIDNDEYLSNLADFVSMCSSRNIKIIFVLFDTKQDSHTILLNYRRELWYDILGQSGSQSWNPVSSTNPGLLQLISDIYQDDTDRFTNNGLTREPGLNVGGFISSPGNLFISAYNHEQYPNLPSDSIAQSNFWSGLINYVSNTLDTIGGSLHSVDILSDPESLSSIPSIVYDNAYGLISEFGSSVIDPVADPSGSATQNRSRRENFIKWWLQYIREYYQSVPLTITCSTNDEVETLFENLWDDDLTIDYLSLRTTDHGKYVQDLYRTLHKIGFTHGRTTFISEFGDLDYGDVSNHWHLYHQMLHGHGASWFGFFKYPGSWTDVRNLDFTSLPQPAYDFYPSTGIYDFNNGLPILRASRLSDVISTWGNTGTIDKPTDYHISGSKTGDVSTILTYTIVDYNDEPVDVVGSIHWRYVVVDRSNNPFPPLRGGDNSVTDFEIYPGLGTALETSGVLVTTDNNTISISVDPADDNKMLIVEAWIGNYDIDNFTDTLIHVAPFFTAINTLAPLPLFNNSLNGTSLVKWDVGPFVDFSNNDPDNLFFDPFAYQCIGNPLIKEVLLDTYKNWANEGCVTYNDTGGTHPIPCWKKDGLHNTPPSDIPSYENVETVQSGETHTRGFGNFYLENEREVLDNMPNAVNAILSEKFGINENLTPFCSAEFTDDVISRNIPYSIKSTDLVRGRASGLLPIPSWFRNSPVSKVALNDRFFNYSFSGTIGNAVYTPGIFAPLSFYRYRVIHTLLMNEKSTIYERNPDDGDIWREELNSNLGLSGFCYYVNSVNRSNNSIDVTFLNYDIFNPGTKSQQNFAAFAAPSTTNVANSTGIASFSIGAVQYYHVDLSGKRTWHYTENRMPGWASFGSGSSEGLGFINSYTPLSFITGRLFVDDVKNIIPGNIGVIGTGAPATIIDDETYSPIVDLLMESIKIQGYIMDYLHYGVMVHPLDVYEVDNIYDAAAAIFFLRLWIKNPTDTSNGINHDKILHAVWKNPSNGDIMLIMGNWHDDNASFTGIFEPAKYFGSDKNYTVSKINPTDGSKEFVSYSDMDSSSNEITGNFIISENLDSGNLAIYEFNQVASGDGGEGDGGGGGVGPDIPDTLIDQIKLFSGRRFEQNNKGGSPMTFLELFGGNVVDMHNTEPDPNTFRGDYYYNTRHDSLYKKVKVTPEGPALTTSHIWKRVSET